MPQVVWSKGRQARLPGACATSRRARNSLLSHDTNCVGTVHHDLRVPAVRIDHSRYADPLRSVSRLGRLGKGTARRAPDENCKKLVRIGLIEVQKGWL